MNSICTVSAVCPNLYLPNLCTTTHSSGKTYGNLWLPNLVDQDYTKTGSYEIASNAEVGLSVLYWSCEKPSNGCDENRANSAPLDIYIKVEARIDAYTLKCSENWRIQDTSGHARIVNEITHPIFEMGSNAIIPKLSFDKSTIRLTLAGISGK